MEHSFNLPWPLAVCAFALFWIALSFLTALGGWSVLAREFATDREPLGQGFLFTDARINRSSYGNCVHAYVERDGILLKATLIFRLFHPPLFLPWDAMHGLTENTDGCTMRFYAGTIKNVRVNLRKDLFAASRRRR